MPQTTHRSATIERSVTGSSILTRIASSSIRFRRAMSFTDRVTCALAAGEISSVDECPCAASRYVHTRT